MPYILLAKYAAFFLIVTTLIYTIYHKGELNERSKWEAQVAKNVKIADEKQKEHLRKIVLLQEGNAKLINRLEKVADDKQDEIDKLTDKLLHTPRLYKSGLCSGGAGDSLPENSNTSKPIKEAPNSPTISEGFRGDLVRITGRSDKVGVYAETAYDFIQELCKNNKDQVICLADK